MPRNVHMEYCDLSEGHPTVNGRNGISDTNESMTEIIFYAHSIKIVWTVCAASQHADYT